MLLIVSWISSPFNLWDYLILLGEKFIEIRNIIVVRCYNIIWRWQPANVIVLLLLICLNYTLWTKWSFWPWQCLTQCICSRPCVISSSLQQPSLVNWIMYLLQRARCKLLWMLLPLFVLRGYYSLWLRWRLLIFITNAPLLLLLVTVMGWQVCVTLRFHLLRELVVMSEGLH